jgi:hypothetical protein
MLYGGKYLGGDHVKEEKAISREILDSRMFFRVCRPV